MLHWPQVSFADHSARGITAGIRAAVMAGNLVAGERLPTVRDIARLLGVSPTTVSEAWQSLSAAGIIESRGRNGTVVLGIPDPVFGPRRYRRVTQGPGRFVIDLSNGTPDPALLPDLRGALLRAAQQQNHSVSYVEHAVLPELEIVLRKRWPFVAESITVVDGSMDALDRIAAIVIHRGDRVLVEHTTFPPLLDLLEQLGAIVVGLATDGEGITVASLRNALAVGPARALVLQPRAQNPTSVSMTAKRARALAAVLRGTDVVVVEDDHCGDIAAAPVVSLGTQLPQQTVRILGFSKSHGPDLRLAAVGGPASIVDAVATRRLLGPGWSSRLLQCVLTDLLTDRESIKSVNAARREYARRRQALVAELRAAGIDAMGDDGINVWIPVAREPEALIALAARGIGAAPGEPFAVRGDSAAHIRVTIAALPAEPSEARTLMLSIIEALQSADGSGWPRPS